MIPIIKWTLRQRRWSTFWWSIGAFALVFINMVFYPSFKNDAEELQKSFENLPDAAVQLFGGSTDFFSPIGFLNSQIFFLMLPLVLTALAIGIGSSLIAREEQDTTIENLLARPVSRSRILAAKALAGLIILSIVTFFALATTLVTAQVVNLEVAASLIVQTTLVCFLMVLSFAAIAFMLTATGRARGASIGLTVFVALGGYIVSSLSSTVGLLETPARLLPFHYYKSESILRGTYDWGNVWYFIILIVAVAFFAWVAFRRRDIG